MQNLHNNKNSLHAFHIQRNHVSCFASMKCKELTVISYLVIPCSRHGQVQEQEKGRRGVDAWDSFKKDMPQVLPYQQD